MPRKPNEVPASCKGTFVERMASRRGRQEQRIAIPMAKQQGEFYIETILGDRPASPCHGAPHSVLNRVEMEGELLCGKRVTRAGVEEDSKCFPAAGHRYRCRRPDVPEPRRPRYGRPRCFRTPAPRPRAQDHCQPRPSAPRACALAQPTGSRLLAHAIAEIRSFQRPANRSPRSANPDAVARTPVSLNDPVVRDLER